MVEIPVQAGEKKFKYEQKVKLVNPKLYGRGYAIGDMGHTDYVLLADDIVAVEYDAMKLRIQYMYESNDYSFMDVLMKATDMADQIGRASCRERV